MDVKFYEKEVSKLDLDFADKKVKNFSSILSKIFFRDKVLFSAFWRSCTLSIQKLGNKNKLKIADLNYISTLSKKIFLINYADTIYNKVTKNRSKYIRIEDLVYEVNKIVPYLTPSKDEIKLETQKPLSDKTAVELDQGVFLSSIYQTKKMENTFVKLFFLMAVN